MKNSYYYIFLATLCMLSAGCTKELTYESKEKPITDNGILADHEYVLIGGVKWATMNIGATTVAGSYDSCIGDYFAWGEITPRYNSKKLGTGIYKYNLSIEWKPEFETGYAAANYTKIESASLDETHDAATVLWGKQWRMPTVADFTALGKACGVDLEDGVMVIPIEKITEGGVYKLTEDQTFEPEYTGVAGALFVSKSDITKRVFFPASGSIHGIKDYGTVGSRGEYWSSEQYYSSSGSSALSAKTLNFYMSSSSSIRNSVGTPSYGLAIRPVAR